MKSIGVSLGDIYPMKYMEKIDRFGRMKFWLPHNLHFKPKLMLQVDKQVRVTDASFRLHGEF